MTASVLLIKSYCSYWYCNNKLHQDNSFIQAFQLFWKAWREEREFFIIKSVVGYRQSADKMFCQQYTAHATRALKEKMKILEQNILQLNIQGNNADSSPREI